MSENSAWVAIATVVAIVIVSVIASNNFISAKEIESITKMVEAGADPLAARCAIISNRGTVCTLIAAKIK